MAAGTAARFNCAGYSQKRPRSFWDNGYPAIMMTDTANMRNPHYHQASDTIETLDLDFLAGVCRGLIEAIRYL